MKTLAIAIFFSMVKEYTIELTGFSQDNGLTSTNEFRVLEEEETTAAIYARISTPPKPAKKVPEPGAIAGLSLLGVYLISRKIFNGKKLTVKG